MNETLDVPDYQQQLNSYHLAFKDELKMLVDDLPFRSSDRILDMGCGDGFYTAFLADRLNEMGMIVAADASDEYLKIAQERLATHTNRSQIHFSKSDIAQLPFPSDYFDFVWCAQSFYSFPDPVKALQELKRVTKPNGILAVLENDTLHEVILPWPPEVELKLRELELAAFMAEEHRPKKYYVGRSLIPLFVEAGLALGEKRSFSRDRLANMDADCRQFLGEYLKKMRERVTPLWHETEAALCDPYINPQSSHYLLNEPTMNATFIDHVIWGRKTT